MEMLRIPMYVAMWGTAIYFNKGLLASRSIGRHVKIVPGAASTTPPPITNAKASVNLALW